MLNKSSPLIVRLKLRLAPYKFCNLYRFLQRFYRIRLPCTKSGLLWHTILEYYATEGFINLILSDRALPVPEVCRASSEFFDLSQMRIAHCLGCFGCWVRTPGRCVIRDDAVRIYPRIAASRKLLYVSRIWCGSYDLPMKTMLERAIPVQQAFIRLWHGETHHLQRNPLPKQALILGYGDISDEEREIFRQLVSRNAHNMNFEEYRIVFTSEEELETIFQKEAIARANS